jgi:Protein of unknown function (DUF3025)
MEAGLSGGWHVGLNAEGTRSLSCYPALLPYFESFAALKALDAEHRLDALNGLARENNLCNYFEQPLIFQGAEGPMKATEYEWAIAGAQGQESAYISTRLTDTDGDHDLFNALIWLRFPKTKAFLNRLQAEEIALARAGEARTRSTRRDQITLFDENGAILVCKDAELIERLEARDWSGFFVDRRDRLLKQAGLHIFGHGLLQKCLSPFKSMTARVWVLGLPREASSHVVDEALAASLAVTWPDWPKRLLPITGLPGWGTGPQDPNYYLDRSVFRS